MKNIFQIGKAWDYVAHRRMIAFWSVMGVMLPLPWIVSACMSPPKNLAHYDNCRVLSVYDGDTMTVNCQGEKIKVRLYCIDAPEMGQKPWGREARDFLRSITGPVVGLEANDRDRYGRIVAVVWHQGQPLNLTMVQAGQAVVYGKYCDDPQYSKSEQYVRRDQLGLWSEPGSHQQPWTWRRAQ